MAEATERPIPPCSISANMIDEWEMRQWPLDKNKLRKGQSFYNHFRLERVTDPHNVLARLYQADGEHADALIRELKDYNN